MEDFWGEITEAMRLLDASLEVRLERGEAMVEAERRYYSIKDRRAIEMRDEGYPATVISSIIKGEPGVVEAMSDYHQKQVEYQNACEATLVYKKKLDVLNSQYEREWSQAGMR